MDVTNLLAKLKAKAAEQQGEPSVVVGFTAKYALYVHEDVYATHTVGQAKYLEQPARTMRPVLARIVRDAMKKGVPLPKALLMAGLRLQREAMLLCPVDTGALRASAFTKLE